ncbi:MAG TPA: hypothetical protein VK582_07165 [Pyrinomonadaceae bacterium]|nr:hypothetical protein [Pyrinomonadaceae bacterium]
MSDFLQLNVKRRQRNGGFLDILKEEFESYKNEPQNISTRLKERVGTWLVEDSSLRLPLQQHDLVSPSYIQDSVMWRICEIAGHVWFEFVEGADDDDSIRATGDYSPDSINAHIAEFIPEPNIDLLLEVFESGGGGTVLWSTITDDHFVRLFAPFLEEPEDPNDRVSGNVGLLSPDKLREYSEPWFKTWFKDRMGAYIMPAWRVQMPSVVIDLLRQQESGLRYSFTPQHDPDADNCVTWVSRVLDKLVPGDWLDAVRVQCNIARPQCGTDSAQLAGKLCVDYHIRSHGRMKCVTLYAKGADEARQAGLREFL